MSTTHTERTERTERSESGRAAGAAGAAAALHPRSFKLRFASQRELGRSHVSAVKPLALPATVTDKFHRREREPEVHEQLRRVQDMFGRGPKQKHAEPVTTSHVYGWWAERARPECRELRHHIRDSAWLKERVRVLATDAGYKR